MKKAADIMSGTFLTVEASASLKKAAQMLLQEKKGGLAVVNENQQITGLIGDQDFIHMDQNLHLPTVFFLLDSPIVLEPFKLKKEMQYLMGQSVFDIMRTEFQTVQENTPVADVCDIMLEQHQEIVPVVNDDCMILGIICQRDILKLHLST